MYQFTKILIPVFFLFMFSESGFSSQFTLSAQAGYNNGPGIQINGGMADFARDLPLKLRLGIVYSAVNPGNAADARQIFINDATNGEPEKAGWVWDLRFDFLYKTGLFSLKNTYIYGGPRYAMFTGNFSYIGGNEDFDITSNQWGLGLGLNKEFNMSTKWDFVINTGVDYYFNSILYGHDTAYSPDGEHRNSRKDYEYSDADKAINQPEINFHFFIGLQYHL